MTYSIHKTVYLLRVPYSVAEIINSFLFIETTEFIKRKKAEISDLIENKAYFSSSMSELFWDVGRNLELYNYRNHNEKDKQKQFYMNFCRKCGEYANQNYCSNRYAKSCVCKI